MQLKSDDDVKRLGTILGVWAHPDDETFSMAGIMATAIRNDQKVVCVTATRGEAGIQDESRWPAHSLANIRSKELASAFKILGVSDHYWLDYPDGRCKEVNADDAVTRIAALITQYNPDSIFTFGPDGMTGHSDHQTVSEWTSKAAEKAGSKATLYHAIQTTEQYEHMLEADKHLNVFFNIDKPPVRDECDCDLCFYLPVDLYKLKLKALKAMPSQTESMLKMFSHVLPQAVGVEAFRLAAPKA